MTRTGSINLRALITLAVVVAVIGAGLLGLRQWRRAALAREARVAAQTAARHGDWATVARHLRIYLEKWPDDRDALLEYGRAQLSVRPLTSANIGAAIGAYRRLLRLDPQNAHAYEKLALIYTETGNAAGLSYLAEQILAHEPTNAGARLNKARALLMQKRSAEAYAELQALLSGDQQATPPPDAQVEACGLLSAIVAEKGTSEALAEARGWLDRAVSLSPDSAKARLWRARFLRTHAEQLGVATEIQTLLHTDLGQAAAHPDPDPRVTLALAEEWLALGELERAAAALAATESIEPNVLERYFLDPGDWVATRFVRAADLALRRGVTPADCRSADQILTSLSERRQRARVLPAAVEVYAAAGLVDRASAYLNEHREILTLAGRGADESVALLEALIGRTTGQPYRVIAALEPLTTRDDARPQALKMLAEAYEAVGQPRRAAKLLANYVSRVADQSALRRLARLYLDLDRVPEALTLARRSEALDPRDLSARLLRIEAELRTAASAASSADMDRLLSELTGLRDSRPDDSAVSALLAITLWAGGDPAGAAQELQRAWTVGRDPVPAVLLHARMRAAEAGPSAAAEVLQDACRLWPSRAELWLAWSDLEAAAGNYAQALALLDHVPDANAATAADLALRRGTLLLRSGQQSDGRSVLQTLANSSDAPIVARCRALSLLLDQPGIDDGQAAALLEQLRTLEGEERGVLWRLHQARLWLAGSYRSDRRRQAAELLEQCVQSDPGWELPAVLLGQVREQEGNPAGAEAVYRRLLSENRAAADALGRLAALLERQGRLDDALALLEEFAPLVASSGPQRAITPRADLAAGNGADLPATSVAGADPRLAATLARLSFARNRDLEQALRYLDAAKTDAGEPSLVTATRVALLRAAGRKDEARRLLETVAAEAHTPDVALLRARFLVADGEVTEAENVLRRLLATERQPRAYAALAAFYADQGRLDEALAVLEQGRADFPQDHELSGRLAETLLLRAAPADRPRLQQLLSDLAQQRPTDPAVTALRARLLALDGTPTAFKAACDLLSQAVEVQPDLLPAYLWLAEYTTRLGDHAAARSWAMRGLALHPRQPALLLWQARAELALGNLALAGELARAVLAQKPADPDAAVVLAAVAIKDQAARREALAALTRAAERQPLSEALRLTQARLLIADGRPAEAVSALEEFRTRSEGTSVTCLLTLADAYAAANQPQAARDTLLAARRTQPDDPAVLRALIARLVADGETQALTRLVEELVRQPDLPADVLVQAARIMLDSPDARLHSLSVGMLEHAVAQASAAHTVRVDAANLLYRAGAVESAVAAYQKLLAGRPDDVRVLNDLAWILAEARQEYVAALEYADRGLQLQPDNPDLLDTRGTILLNVPGRLPQARIDFERCAAVLSRTAPGSAAHARALWQLGRVCFDLGDSSAARNAIREALDIDGRHSVFTADERPQVRRLLDRLTQQP